MAKKIKKKRCYRKTYHNLGSMGVTEIKFVTKKDYEDFYDIKKSKVK